MVTPEVMTRGYELGGINRGFFQHTSEYCPRISPLDSWKINGLAKTVF